MTEPRPIYPKYYFREPVPRQRTGFILMPFKAEFEPVHEAIRTAIEAADLFPLRADDIFSTRAGMEKILRGIAEAEVVVADMTGRNANVFYETGIAHTIKDNVVLLTQNIEDIPFDFRHIDHIEYTATRDGLLTLTADLQRVVESLDPEPVLAAAPPSPVGGPPASPTEMRRELRRLLQDCEEQWVHVIPTQDEIFRNTMREKILSTHETRDTSAEKTVVLDSIKSVQRAFLEPWQPIEELGVRAIEEEGTFEAVTPEIFQALERAYELPTRGSIMAIHPEVYSHGQLLTLRTWVLWGAFALACRNWHAVETLLHKEATFWDLFDTTPTRVPFKDFLDLYYPRACRGYSDVAILSIHQQLPDFSEKHFFDEEEMVGYIELWLFAVAVESDFPGKDLNFPRWEATTGYHFPKLILALESDPAYARNFSKAVARLEPAELNRKWESGIRQQIEHIWSPRRLADHRDLDPPHIPSHFAE